MWVYYFLSWGALWVGRQGRLPGAFTLPRVNEVRPSVTMVATEKPRPKPGLVAMGVEVIRLPDVMSSQNFLRHTYGPSILRPFSR